MSQKRVEVKIKDMKFYVVGGEDPSYIKNLATELNAVSYTHLTLPTTERV